MRWTTNRYNTLLKKRSLQSALLDTYQLDVASSLSLRWGSPMN